MGIEEFLCLYLGCLAYLLHVPFGTTLFDLGLRVFLPFTLAVGIFPFPAFDGTKELPHFEEIPELLISMDFTRALFFQFVGVFFLGYLLGLPGYIFVEFARIIGDMMDSLLGLNMQFQYDAQQSEGISVLGALCQKIAELLFIASPVFLYSLSALLSFLSLEGLNQDLVISFLLLLFEGFCQLLAFFILGLIPLVLLFLCLDVCISVLGKFVPGVSVQGIQQLTKLGMLFAYAFQSSASLAFGPAVQLESLGERMLGFWYF